MDADQDEDDCDEDDGEDGEPNDAAQQYPFVEYLCLLYA